MDPITILGVAASVVQLVDSALKVAKYINNVKDAPKERDELALELYGLQPLLIQLRQRIEESKGSEQWYDGIRRLGGPDGPIEQLTLTLDAAALKLKPKTGVKKVLDRLVWNLKKEEIAVTLGKIERLKSLVNLALQDDTFTLLRVVRKDTEDIKKVADALQKVQLDEEAEKMIKWLSNLDFAPQHIKIQEQRQKGTCEWLFREKDFDTWNAEKESKMLCTGIPGAGKTVLASSVIKHFEDAVAEQGPQMVAYVFCDYSDQARQNITNILGCIAQQLIRQLSGIPEALRILYAAQKNKATKPKRDEIFSVLEAIAKLGREILVVIDALDECESHTRLDLLQGLSTLKMSFLCTSRPSTETEHVVEWNVRMEVKAQDEDLRLFLGKQIEDSPRLQRLCHKTPNLQEQIVVEIVKKAGGMFLAAKLHIAALGGKSNVAAIKKALANLPDNLDSIYDVSMQRISKQEEDGRLALSLITWIYYTFVATDLELARYAVTIMDLTSEDTELDVDALPDPDILLEACGGLIVLDAETDELRFVHESTRAYFTKHVHKYFPTGKGQIADACLRFFSLDAFAILPKDVLEMESIQKLKSEWPPDKLSAYEQNSWGPWLTSRREAEEDHANLKEEIQQFLPYNALFIVLAARNWAWSARQADETRQQEMLEFLKKDKNFAFWGLAFNIFSNIWASEVTYPYSSVPEPGFKIHFAAAMELDPYIDNLEAIDPETSNKDDEINQKDSYLDSALHVAASWGNTDTASKLLKKGAKVNSQNSVGNTPLLLAANDGQDALTALLIAHGADVNIHNNEGEAPIHVAANAAIVSFLLKAGASVNDKNNANASPLHLATTKSNIPVMKILLDNGADLAAGDTINQTPLHYAETGQSTLLLLERGADLKIRDDDGQTPLHDVCQWNGASAATVLLDHGAEIEAHDNKGRTPVFSAVQAYDVTALKLLLDRGADFKVIDKDGWTPLHLAASIPHEAAMEALLGHGISVNVIGSSGLTPLHIAVGFNKLPAINFLLDHGADPAIQEVPGVELWHRVGSFSNPETAKLLLERGVLQKDANVKSKSIQDWTPLHFAAKYGNVQIMLFLLEHGAELEGEDSALLTPLVAAIVNSQKEAAEWLINHGASMDGNIVDNSGGFNAILTACSKGFVDLVSLMLEKGADIESRTWKYRLTPLLLTAKLGTAPGVEKMLDTTKLLLERGASVKARDRQERGALHYLSRCGDFAVMDMWIEHGAEIQAEDGDGNTPLHYAVAYHEVEIVKLLLQSGGDLKAKDKFGRDAAYFAKFPVLESTIYNERYAPPAVTLEKTAEVKEDKQQVEAEKAETPPPRYEEIEDQAAQEGPKVVKVVVENVKVDVKEAIEELAAAKTEANKQDATDETGKDEPVKETAEAVKENAEVVKENTEELKETTEAVKENAEEVKDTAEDKEAKAKSDAISTNSVRNKEIVEILTEHGCDFSTIQEVEHGRTEGIIFEHIQIYP